jgi:hypothetical protein
MDFPTVTRISQQNKDTRALKFDPIAVGKILRDLKTPEQRQAQAEKMRNEQKLSELHALEELASSVPAQQPAAAPALVAATADTGAGLGPITSILKSYMVPDQNIAQGATMDRVVLTATDAQGSGFARNVNGKTVFTVRNANSLTYNVDVSRGFNLSGAETVAKAKDVLYTTPNQTLPVLFASNITFGNPDEEIFAKEVAPGQPADPFAKQNAGPGYDYSAVPPLRREATRPLHLSSIGGPL